MTLNVLSVATLPQMSLPGVDVGEEAVEVNVPWPGSKVRVPEEGVLIVLMGVNSVPSLRNVVAGRVLLACKAEDVVPIREEFDAAATVLNVEELMLNPRVKSEGGATVLKVEDAMPIPRE